MEMGGLYLFLLDNLTEKQYINIQGDKFVSRTRTLKLILVLTRTIKYINLSWFLHFAPGT